jgi:hypothetical protein
MQRGGRMGSVGVHRHPVAVWCSAVLVAPLRHAVTYTPSLHDLPQGPSLPRPGQDYPSQCVSHR